MKKVALLCSICALTVACSSTPKSGEIAMQTSETQPDKVLSRIDDLNQRPSWTQEQRPFRQEGDKIVSQAMTQIPSDHRIESAYRICFNSAKGSIATAIEQKLQFIFQQSSEGTEMDHSTAQFIGSEMATMTSSSLKPTNQYWEKYATTDDSGVRKIYFRIFCTVEMPQQDFRNSVLAALRKAEGHAQISSDFRAKVDSQWNSFVNAPQPQVGPASVPAQGNAAKNDAGHE